jgi:hypothetical protein
VKPHDNEIRAEGPLLPERVHVRLVTAADTLAASSEPMATRDHAVIERWATRYQATPATGEETTSGSASGLHVADGSAGIRFNFPAAGLFRPITWDEWFDNFDRYSLTLVFELTTEGSTSMPRYRIVKAADWLDWPDSGVRASR